MKRRLKMGRNLSKFHVGITVHKQAYFLQTILCVQPLRLHRHVFKRAKLIEFHWFCGNRDTVNAFLWNPITYT